MDHPTNKYTNLNVQQIELSQYCSKQAVDRSYLMTGVCLSGADIIMQLDDVVSSTTTGPRVEEAMHRSVVFSLHSECLLTSGPFFCLFVEPES